MIKILDKFVTGFFIVIFGILWYCSSKYQVNPSQYTVIVYDVFGRQTKMDGIRTRFKTIDVAQSYISEYQKRFEDFSFSMAQEIHIIKNPSYRIFRKIQR